MSSNRIAILVIAALPAALPLRAQRTDLAPLPVDAAYPVCAAWLHEWTEGSQGDPGLLTFGAPFLLRYAAAEASDRERGPIAVTRSLVERRAASVGAVGVELLMERGPLLAGASEPTDVQDVYHYPGPRRSSRTSPAVRVRKALSWNGLAAAADVATDGHEIRVRSLGGGISRGPLLVYGGALPARTGPDCGGGLVLGGAGGPVWGVELLQNRPVRLPVIGRVQLALQIGALREAGPGNRWPFFHAMRVEVRPGEDVVFGLNRAVIFGGSRSPVAVTPRTVGLMLVGVTDTRGKDSDFENQVASLDVRWRTRAADRPLLLAAEYGVDDSGYAFARVPGVRVQGEIAWSPFGAGWTGVSLVAIAPPTGTYPAWYRHGALAWGWTDRGTPLGSPLGGDGWGALATWRRESAAGGLALGAGPFVRGGENLFAPDLEGTGLAATIGLDHAFGPWEVEVQGRLERAGAFAGQWTSSLVRRF